MNNFHKNFLESNEVPFTVLTVVIFFALTITAAIAAVYSLLIKKKQTSPGSKATPYKKKYSQLMHSLEKSTKICNRLESMVPNMIKARHLVDYYISTLNVLETLLISMREMEPQAKNVAAMDTALFLADDCLARCMRVEHAFVTFNKKGKFSLKQLLSKSGPGFLDPIGCYFCSRPYAVEKFERVKAVINKKHLEVFACNICAKELKEKKTATVLAFVENKIPIHWAQFPGYKPDKKYFDINNKEKNYPGRPKPVFSKPLLRVVKPNSSDNKQK